MPDVFEDKSKLASDNTNTFDKRTGERKPKANEYSPPKPHRFRDEAEIELGMKDFITRVKIDPIENPHALSVFAQKPKFITDKEKEKEEAKDALDKFLAAGKPHDWIKYHSLPELLEPVT